jgi:hypothetical protein
MCQHAPHVCARTHAFLALPTQDQWIGEEDAAHQIQEVTAFNRKITVHTAAPAVLAFCHRPPWCFTMMTLQDYYDQSWLPGVP